MQQDKQDKNSIKFKLLCFLCLNILLIGSTLFEQVRINDGLGWDGMKYADITRSFLDFLTTQSLDSYSIQRIFPSGLVYGMMKLLGLSFTNNNIIISYTVYNIILINLSIFIWFKILGMFSFSRIISLASLILLIGNFCILKYCMYYPVLTDVTTFFLGMLLLYAYLKNNPVLLLITGFICAFSHPLLQYFSILLFIFPRRNTNKEVRSYHFMRIFPYVISFLYAVVILTLYFKKPNIIDGHVWMHTDPVNRSLIFLSLFCAMVYLFYIGKSVIRNKIVEMSLRDLRISRLFVGLALFAITYVIKQLLSGPMQGFGMINFAVNVTLQSISDPFEFLLSHIIYFGIGVLLIIFYFKKYERQLSDFGTGYMIIVYLILFLAIGSETRQFTFALPFVILPVVSIINKLSVKGILPYIICSSILLSKIWMPVNLGDYLDEPVLFPDQYLFMSLGPWMIWPMYVLQLVVVLVLGIIYLAFYYKRDPILISPKAKSNI